MQQVVDEVPEDHLPGGFLEDRGALADELARRLEQVADDVRRLDANAAVEAEVRRFLTGRGSRLDGGLLDVLDASEVDDSTLLRQTPRPPVRPDSPRRPARGPPRRPLPRRAGLARAGPRGDPGPHRAAAGRPARAARPGEPARAVPPTDPRRAARGRQVTAPLPGEPAFRCARSSVLRDEAIAGTGLDRPRVPPDRAPRLLGRGRAPRRPAARRARAGAAASRRRGADPGAADPAHRSPPGQ